MSHPCVPRRTTMAMLTTRHGLHLDGRVVVPDGPVGWRGVVGAVLLVAASGLASCDRSSPDTEARDTGPRDLGAGDASPELGLPDLGVRDLGGAEDLGPSHDGGHDAGRDLGQDTGPGMDAALPCSSDRDCHGCSICEGGTCSPCQCSTDEDCGPGAICVGMRCEDDCTVTGCLAGEVCDPDLGRCVPDTGCHGDGDCPDGSVCLAEGCVQAEAYDSCAAPLELAPGVPVEVDTRYTRDHYGGSCSTRPSPEAVLSFELAETAGVEISVDGSRDHFDPLVYLTFGPCGGGPEHWCSDTRFSYRERVTIPRLPQGRYYLFVESFGPDARGRATVTLETSPGGLCPDDVLEDDDSPLTPAPPGLAQATPLSLCPGDEDWYSVAIHQGDDLAVSIAGTIAAGAPEPWVRLLDPGGREVPMEARSSVGEGGEWTFDGLAQGLATSGTYVLGLGLGGQPEDPLAASPYTIDMEVLTREGTPDCTNPPSMRPGEPVHGDTSAGVSVIQGSCASQLHHDAPELVYKVHLHEPGSLTASVRADWLYTVYLERACGDQTTELGCRAPGDLFLPALDPGTYYLVVDGFRDESGPFDLLVDVGPPIYPPENDGCAQAIDVTLGQEIHGDTTFAQDDYRASCTAPLSHDAGDVVYRFELDRRTRVVATLDTGDRPWAGCLYLRTTCLDMRTEQGCDDLGPRLDLELDAGEYFLFVDGWRDGHGEFTLHIYEPEE